jgi:hypothetical protein
VQIVAAALEGLENGPMEQGGEGATLLDRNEGVMVSPKDEEGWKLRDFRHAMEEISPLSAPAHDVSDGPCECARGTGA